MNSEPNFRMEAGELVLKASKKAATAEKIHLSQVAKGVPFVPKNPKDVLEEAKVRVVQGGGDPTNDLLLASQSAIQFGQYRGRTFKWLLENDCGYSLMILSRHQREREGWQTGQRCPHGQQGCLPRVRLRIQNGHRGHQSVQAERGHITWL